MLWMRVVNTIQNYGCLLWLMHGNVSPKQHERGVDYTANTPLNNRNWLAGTPTIHGQINENFKW